MQIRLRTGMKVVAVIAIVLGVITHVVRLFKVEDDFASGFLMIEAVGVVLLGGIALGIRYIVNLVRDDDRYARELRQSDGPCDFRWSTDEIEVIDQLKEPPRH